MNATTQFGLSVLLAAALLFNPAACGAMAKGATRRAHPCCPAPANHSAKPICVCGNTAPASIAAPSSGDHGRTSGGPASKDLYQTHALIRNVTATETVPLALDHRFITLHQF